jgi:hypothetical protein
MKLRMRGFALFLVFACVTRAGVLLAADAPFDSTTASADSGDVPWTPVSQAPKLESLVPELAEHPYHLTDGVMPFERRLAVSPSFGYFGTDRLYRLSVTFHPTAWLGYEASFSHNPSTSVHALLHSLSAIVRRPLPGRFQPYLAAGYGMIVVFPGLAVNAVSVTKNAVTAGGGLDVFIRDDLAIRADLRHATVFGQQRGREGVVAYDYVQGTIGFAFYRSLRP